MAFRRRPPTGPPPPDYPGTPPDEQVTLVEGRPPPPPPPPDDLPPGGPPPGDPDRALWPWLLLLLVLVLIGAGLAAYFATRDDHKAKLVTVPRVVGFKESAALNRLRDAGFDTNVSRSFGDQAAGFVISQNPQGGRRARKGRVVAVVVSQGPSSVAVPNVISLNEADAVTQLTQAGLKADVFQVPSNQKVGQVIAQNPSAGSKLNKGSKVRLNVSKGQTQTTTVVTTSPTTTATTATTTGTTTATTTTTTTTASTSVPDVVGQTVAAATSQLQSAQLVANSYPVSSSEPGGTVVAQNPDSGTSVDAGSAVRLNVSTGTTRSKIAMPSVIGATTSRALSTLTKTFTVRIAFRPAGSGQRGVVVAQAPAAGRTAPRWAQVIIYVSK
jgi:serine/threonine-protein kinase